MIRFHNYTPQINQILSASKIFFSHAAYRDRDVAEWLQSLGLHFKVFFIGAVSRKVVIEQHNSDTRFDFWSKLHSQEIQQLTEICTLNSTVSHPCTLAQKICDCFLCSTFSIKLSVHSPFLSTDGTIHSCLDRLSYLQVSTLDK